MLAEGERDARLLRLSGNAVVGIAGHENRGGKREATGKLARKAGARVEAVAVPEVVVEQYAADGVAAQDRLELVVIAGDDSLQVRLSIDEGADELPIGLAIIENRDLRNHKNTPQIPRVDRRDVGLKMC